MSKDSLIKTLTNINQMLSAAQATISTELAPDDLTTADETLGRASTALLIAAHAIEMAVDLLEDLD